MRIGCYHARSGFPDYQSPRFGQRVRVWFWEPRKAKPHNVLVEFKDGYRASTSMGCIRWKCEHRGAGK